MLTRDIALLEAFESTNIVSIKKEGSWEGFVFMFLIPDSFGKNVGDTSFFI